MSKDNPFPTKLKMARVICGLSRVALAEKIGISPEKLKKYEAGHLLPDSDAVIAFSEALQQPVDFFYRPTLAKPDTIFFRKRRSLSKSEASRVIYEASDFFDRFREVERALGIETDFINPIHGIEICNGNDVENAAERVRRDWGLGTAAILNVLEILEKANITVLISEHPKNFDGFSQYIEKYPFIVLNNRFPVDRLRFTALHEAGHLLLSFDARLNDSEQETFCNQFAGAMLMPQQVFKDEFGGRRSQLSIHELIGMKEKYGISIAAIMYRARDLELISPQIHKDFCIQASINKWRDHEPGRIDIVESADRFYRLVYRAAATDALSISRCAGLLKKTVSAFRHDAEFVP